MRLETKFEALAATALRKLQRILGDNKNENTNLTDVFSSRRKLLQSFTQCMDWSNWNSTIKKGNSDLRRRTCHNPTTSACGVTLAKCVDALTRSSTLPQTTPRATVMHFII
jgi:hypothetical protein